MRYVTLGVKDTHGMLRYGSRTWSNFVDTCAAKLFPPMNQVGAPVISLGPQVPTVSSCRIEVPGG